MEQIINAGPIKKSKVTEQAFDSKADKWVEGVLNLIRLTQDGKMLWRPISPSDPAFRVAYESKFGENRVLLERTLLVEEPANAKGWEVFLTGVMRASMIEKISLQVIKPDGTLLMHFPPIPPLRGLVAAVEAQISRESDGFLDALAAA